MAWDFQMCHYSGEFHPILIHWSSQNSLRISGNLCQLASTESSRFECCLVHFRAREFTSIYTRIYTCQIWILWCLCLCVCIHMNYVICIYTVYMCINIYIYIYTCICICRFVCVCMHVCVYTSMYMYMGVVCVCMCVCYIINLQFQPVAATWSFPPLLWSLEAAMSDEILSAGNKSMCSDMSRKFEKDTLW